MKILLVTKKTNLEILEDRIKKLKISDENFLECLHTSHKEHYDGLVYLRELLKQANIETVELKRGMPWPSEKFDTIVTLGGDGTLLSASHQVPEGETPILAVRSSDESVGYLCSAHHKNMKHVIKQLKNPEKHLMQLERLYAEVTRDSKEALKTPPILNDFLFANRNPASTTRYEIEQGEIKESHKSSGVWVSSPTGSTAAIGTISEIRQKLSEKEFQFKTRELYPKAELFKLSGGLFNPDKESFSITNHNNKAILAIDGQHGTVHLTIGDKMTFKRAKPLLVYKPLSAL